MPASAEPRSGAGNLLDPRRSAHASIRGYLYQTCLGVLRWLDLQPNEVLLCEGDEDLDRFLLGGGAVSEQVKAYTGGLSITDRVVRDSLRNYLRSYVALRQRGETRKFVFTTTAYEKKRRDGLNLDLLEAWKGGDRTVEVIAKVRSLVQPPPKDPKKKETEKARRWLDWEMNRWVGFMDSVEWTFRAPELDLLRLEIEGKLKAERNVSSPRAILDHLVVQVLTTSSQKDAEKRILTSEILEAQIHGFLADLARLAGSREVQRIRTVFDEIDELRDLLDEGTRDLPENPTPGQILTAAFEVLPFDEKGREEELDFLASWCGGADRRSVLLLTGEGGSGKTRLMLEWCRRLRHQGWHAGFLMRNRDEDDILPLVKGTAPRLVVVDYAETRLDVVEPLVEEIGQVPQNEGPKLRVVLLARGPRGSSTREAAWWKNLSLLSGDVALLLAGSEPRQIRPLIPQDFAQRQQAFRNAVEGFAKSLEHEVPKDLHTPDLSGPQFDRALYLHMAALSALHGERIETAEDALEHTLAHERRIWRNQVKVLVSDRYERDALTKAFEMAVAVVTLVNGTADFPEAYDLFARVLRPPQLPSGLGVIIEMLSALYRSSDEEDKYSIDSLQPDLLSEEWGAKVLEQDEGLLARILDGAIRKQAYSTLTVLTRLARRRPDLQRWIGIALHGRLEQLAEIALDVAVETGDPAGVELARELGDNGSPEVVVLLQRKCDSEKYMRSVHLVEVAQVATEKGLALLSKRQTNLDEKDQVEYARLAHNLGYRLSYLGRIEDALAATQQAIEIFRQLAQRGPDIFLSGLAMSLNNLSDVLSGLGRQEDALTAIQEAVEISRSLAQQRPDAFLPTLAVSLHSLRNVLSKLGRREDAFNPIQEATKIRRQLAQQNPNVLPDLALSLTNLGSSLSDLGRRDEALDSFQEAVEIYRQLARQRPDVFLPHLAMILINLSLGLRALERPGDALQPSQEAVEVYRQLARQRLDTFLPQLANSLNTLGTILDDLKRREEALSATQEAVEIYQQLARQRPDAFLPDLAMSLNNLGSSLSALERHEEALIVTQDAIRIKRELARQKPDALLPNLATGLTNLASMLSGVGRQSDALQAADEAIRILAPFFLRLPAAFGPGMAIMIHNYLELAKATTKAPDAELLNPILKVLRSFHPDQESENEFASSP